MRAVLTGQTLSKTLRLRTYDTQELVAGILAGSDLEEILDNFWIWADQILGIVELGMSLMLLWQSVSTASFTVLIPLGRKTKHGS